MNPDPVEQLIQLRLQQARESLMEAKTLREANLLRGSVNRAYYAMFYAVLALMILRQETTSKHTGVIAFFDREFVKTGILSRELSKSLHIAFQKRQENDYGDIVLVDNAEADQSILDANAFVQGVENFLSCR